MATVTVTPEYLRQTQAATLIGMSEDYLRKECRLGRGPKRIFLGQTPVYQIEELRRWMASRTEQERA